MTTTTTLTGGAKVLLAPVLVVAIAISALAADDPAALAEEALAANPGLEALRARIAELDALAGAAGTWSDPVLAIDYLNAIGLEAVQRHEHEIVRYAYARLHEVDGLHILGPPPEKRSSLISFTLTQPHAHDVAQLLDQHGIAVRAGHHCTQPLHDRLGIAASTRASFYLYNTPAEVDQLVNALKEIERRFRPQGRRRHRKTPDR